MFVQATRWSFPNNDTNIGKEIYDNSIPMWQQKPGFHSIALFDIVEGPHQGHRMVVIRFDTQENLMAARERLAPQREQISKDCETAGLKLEEMIRLNEVA